MPALRTAHYLIGHVTFAVGGIFTQSWLEFMPTELHSVGLLLQLLNSFVDLIYPNQWHPVPLQFLLATGSYFMPWQTYY